MNVADMNAAALRGVDPDRVPGLHPQFPGRWSPRAMSGEPVAPDELTALLEAARWAPSCFNAQPWRFAYALRNDAAWPRFFDLLMELNQVWAVRAGALIAVASRQSYEHNGQPAPTHAFDAGAAWMSLALQGSHLGLVCHGMWGFHHARAPEVLGLPELYELHAMVAVGRPGAVEDLPEPVRAREQPTPRKPLDQIAFAGGFHSLEDSA